MSDSIIVRVRKLETRIIELENLLAEVLADKKEQTNGTKRPYKRRKDEGLLQVQFVETDK